MYDYYLSYLLDCRTRKILLVSSISKSSTSSVEILPDEDSEDVDRGLTL